jgi:hypothetical protein
LKYTINCTKEQGCSVLGYIFYDGLFETDFEMEIRESIIALEPAVDFFSQEILTNREVLSSWSVKIKLNHSSLPQQKNSLLYYSKHPPS